MKERLARDPVVFASVMLAYVFAGKVGLNLAVINASVSAVWAPTGIAIATLLMIGMRLWPAVALGAFIVNFTTTGLSWTSAWTAALIAIGNTAEGAVGAHLVARFAGGPDTFQSSQSVFRFTALVGLFSTTISATIGVTTLAASGLAHWADYPALWMTWWMGDLTGALVICPFVLLWSVAPWRQPWLTVLEEVALLLLLVGIGLVVFDGFFPSHIKNYPLEFLVVPCLMWAAFSFGRREAAAAVLILSGMAVWGTYHGVGPFARQTHTESFLLLQAFVGVTAVMSVALAAVVGEHKQATAQARDLSVTDPLTGLANLRRLNEVVQAEVVRSARTRRPFSILFLDLDGLKAINDRHGHLAGNHALCRVADILRNSCRAMDTPARFGGDEFVVILPETDESGARHVAQRVVERVAADRTAKPALSVSTGIAEYPRDGATSALLLSVADRILYQAKANRKGNKRPQQPRLL